MPNCEHCGREMILPFTCAYCGGHYCVEHRLPERHGCSHLPKNSPPYISPAVTKDKVTEEKSVKVGMCPQCHHCSDNIVDYNAETVIFQCRRCGYKFRQSKATPNSYIESTEKTQEKLEPVEKPACAGHPLKRKKLPLKKLITLAIVALIVGVVIWSAPQFPSSNSGQPQSHDSSSDPLPNTPPPITLPETLSHEELVTYALSLINSDRTAKGLQNVTLSSIDFGQRHAEDMLEKNYFSHWDMKGLKPHMRYTLAGGTEAVSENIAAYIGGIDTDLKTALKNLEWSMMYDDASSQWGHRDNILTP